MITFEYKTELESRNLLNLPNRISAGVQTTMQIVLDRLVQNIKGHFSDNALAETITSFIQSGGVRASDDFVIEGIVTSTWTNMTWYENGREPGGKMPPRDALLAYAARHDIHPDPAKAALAFAFAINVARLKKNKHAVPLDALVEWQNRAGIVVPEDFQLNSMAYAIGKKIVRDGIPGKHYFQIGLEDTQSFINESFESVVVTSTGIR